MSADNYGQYFWKVATPEQTMMVYADRATVLPDGTLAMIRDARDDKPELLLIALPPGRWTYVAAASLIDGSSVAIDSVVTSEEDAKWKRMEERARRDAKKPRARKMSQGVYMDE